jgi:hypothetical protein
MKSNQMFPAGEDRDMHPLQVVIYGSSLFMNAVTALLKQATALNVITMPPGAQLAEILQRDPDAILYQADTPPACLDALLTSGVCCGELDTHSSVITVRRSQNTQEAYSVFQAHDLLASIGGKKYPGDNARGADILQESKRRLQ